MPAKKKSENKTKRYYHADGYTYDEYYPSGMEVKHLIDPSRSKLDDQLRKRGAVGPERTKDYFKRIMERRNFIEKNPNLRVLDTSRNKARGTQSSTTRKPIK